MTLSHDQTTGGCSSTSADQEQSTTSGIPAVEVSRLRLALWTVTTEAMFLSWNTTPLSEEDILSLGTELGDLLRYLARRHISPIDEPGESPTRPTRRD